MKNVSHMNTLQQNKRSSKITSKKPLVRELSPVNNKAKAIQLNEKTDLKCNLCHNGFPTDVLESGKFYQLSNMAFHYFCLLFAEGGEQNGEDEEGLFGFLLSDLRILVEKSSEYMCMYCSKPGAMARCCRRGCGRLFHFPCGLEADATFQFMANMDVYCGEHRVRQRKDLTGSTPPDYDCVVCYEEVGRDVGDAGRIVVPCCKRHFHKNCVQKMALSSGKHHFKCPNCNNKKMYAEEIERLGVYVPFADATWETEEHSTFYNYGDMYVQERTCTAEQCLSTNEGGRSYHGEGGEFAVVLCRFCGTTGVHVLCGSLDLGDPEFGCSDCDNTGDVPQTLEEVVQNEEIGVEDKDAATDNMNEIADKEEAIPNKDLSIEGISAIQDIVKDVGVASYILNEIETEFQEEAIQNKIATISSSSSVEDIGSKKNDATEILYEIVSNKEVLILNQDRNIEKDRKNIEDFEECKDLIVKYRTISDEMVNSCLKCGFTVPTEKICDVIKHIKIKHKIKTLYPRPCPKNKKPSFPKPGPKSSKIKPPHDTVEPSRSTLDQYSNETDELDNLLKELEEEESPVVPINEPTILSNTISEESKQIFPSIESSHVPLPVEAKTTSVKSKKILSSVENNSVPRSPSSPLPVKSIKNQENLAKENKRVRRKRCNKCEGCTRNDCGTCEMCRDMPKFEGLNKKKKACLKRQCLSNIPPVESNQSLLPVNFLVMKLANQISSPPESNQNLLPVETNQIASAVEVNQMIPNRNNAPIATKQSKRPFLCPVCNSSHKTLSLLQKHLANLHFFKRLLNMAKCMVVRGIPLYSCPEENCKYANKNKNCVAEHLSNDHDVVFRIVKESFPGFLKEPNKVLNNTCKKPAVVSDNQTEVIDLAESPVKSKTTVSPKRKAADLNEKGIKKTKTGQEDLQNRKTNSPYQIPPQNTMGHPMMPPNMIIPPWMENRQQQMMPQSQMPAQYNNYMEAGMHAPVAPQWGPSPIEEGMATQWGQSPAPQWGSASVEGGRAPQWGPSPIYSQMWQNSPIF